MGYALFRNTAYDGGIRIFCKWRTGELPWRRDDVLAAFSQGVALIAPAPAHMLPPSPTDCADREPLAGDVAVVEDRPGHMTLQVTSATGGIVFVPDNYDSGWRGTVNGMAASVIQVYGSYLGIPVGEGRTVVSLDYHDDYFWLGVATSLLAAIGLCGYAAFARFSRRPT
jgi:hypothetical protein